MSVLTVRCTGPNPLDEPVPPGGHDEQCSAVLELEPDGSWSGADPLAEMLAARGWAYVDGVGGHPAEVYCPVHSVAPGD